MNGKVASLVFATVILLSMLAFQSVNVVSANFMPWPTPQPAITIQKDGTISPASSSIVQSGNTYTLTDNITDYTIVVDRDNIILEGANHMLQGESNLAGVFVQEHNNVTVQNLNIRGFKYGILFTWLSYGYSSTQKANTVSNNTLSGNNYGIYFGDFSQGNTISANTVTNNTYGIYLGASSNNALRNNHMFGNEFNFFVYGSGSEAANYVDTSNTVDGKFVIYWVNQQDRQVPFDAGYVALVNCKGIIVQNLNLSHNGQAMLLVGVSNSTLQGNTLTENDNAIWIVNSNNMTVTQNVLSNNCRDALYMVSTNDTTITGNVFRDGGLNGTASEEATSSGGQAAIWISSSANNVVYNNTFSGNGEGISLQNCNNHLITSNLLSDTNGTAIHLFGCSQNNITDNNITSGKGIGVKIWSSENNTVQSNLIADNVLGILLDSSAGNSILDNTVANNTDWGMQLKSVSDTFSSSKNNTIIHNNFINNQQGEGLDVSVPGLWVYPGGLVPGLGNIWDDGSQGNYWGDYKVRYPNASELPATGTWDTPWIINENNVDHHPQMTPNNKLSNPSQSGSQNPTPSASPSPTLTANPTISASPSAPEFPAWTVIPLILASALLIIYRKRGNKR